MEMDPTPGYRFASWADGYGDVHCVPDLSTLRRTSWLEHSALVICDVHDEKTEALAAVAPRSILRKQIEHAHALGLEPMGGTELEFFVLRETYESAERKNFDRLEPFGWYIEDYHSCRARGRGAGRCDPPPPAPQGAGRDLGEWGRGSTR
jgi:glutamine synthetase